MAHLALEQSAKGVILRCSAQKLTEALHAKRAALHAISSVISRSLGLKGGTTSTVGVPCRPAGNAVSAR